MSDFALSVTVTRTWLGLEDLELNDHQTYAVAPGSFGAQVTWERNAIGSPYMDDDITVSRRRGKVMEPLVIEVHGEDHTLTAALRTLVGALTQDTFALSVNVNGRLTSYACEAADYTLSWIGPRLAARQLQASFAVPRSPVPLVGV